MRAALSEPSWLGQIFVTCFVQMSFCILVGVQFVCRAWCELWNLCNKHSKASRQCLARDHPYADVFFCWPGSEAGGRLGLAFVGRGGHRWRRVRKNNSLWQKKSTLRTGFVAGHVRRPSTPRVSGRHMLDSPSIPRFVTPGHPRPSHSPISKLFVMI